MDPRLVAQFREAFIRIDLRLGQFREYFIRHFYATHLRRIFKDMPEIALCVSFEPAIMLTLCVAEP